MDCMLAENNSGVYILAIRCNLERELPKILLSYCCSHDVQYTVKNLTNTNTFTTLPTSLPNNSSHKRVIIMLMRFATTSPWRYTRTRNSMFVVCARVCKVKISTRQHTMSWHRPKISASQMKICTELYSSCFWIASVRVENNTQVFFATLSVVGKLRRVHAIS